MWFYRFVPSTSRWDVRWWDPSLFLIVFRFLCFPKISSCFRQEPNSFPSHSFGFIFFENKNGNNNELFVMEVLIFLVLNFRINFLWTRKKQRVYFYSFQECVVVKLEQGDGDWDWNWCFAIKNNSKLSNLREKIVL